MAALSANAQSAFTPGNLVVLQTSGTSNKASSAVTLREFTTGGTAGITVSIPNSGPTPLQVGGQYGGSEGFLSTSADDKYIVLGGYATAATIGDITASAATTAPRAIGLVYPSGFYLQYDTSRTFYSANDIRGGISDGTNFWASGASNDNVDGINYFGPNARAALATASTPPKAYGLRIFNGNIYYSTQKSGPVNTGSQLGIFQLGTNLPTAGPVTVSQIINTGGTAIPEDFSFNPAGNICYIAINLNNATGGIQKWTKSGSTWSLAYTLISGTGTYGLVADYTGPQAVIYATTFETGGNRVIKITDAGAASAATTLVPITSGTYYKGITFAPVASGTPLVNISVSKDTASEAMSSVITVTANTSAPVVGAQTVSVSVSGTGITAGDYTLSNTTITIPSGATSGSVTFTVVNDILGEGAETASLTISSPTAGISLGMRPTQKVTIADNDGNNHPTIVLDPSTTNFIDTAMTTSKASPFKLSGVVSDPTDPGSTPGLNLLVNDLETTATSLTVTAVSNNSSVVPAANLSLTGSGAIRNLKITPAAVGYSDITISVTDGIDVTTYIVNYAASAASALPANTVWHTGMSDGSDLIVQDNSYYISADDEMNILNVYSRAQSGMPLASYNYTSGLNLPNPGSPEVDIEASAVSPANANRSYWMGSMSNGKAPFDNKPNRDRIFATTYSGTGATTTFAFTGYAALRTSLLAWGDANGYAFSASAAAGVDSKSPSGFAAEGMVFGPDNTTLYIGLRAPLVPTAARTKAVIAPINNFETWFNNGAPSGSPAYGAPIELELGGRGIRDIIRLANGSYVIIAGSPSGTISGAIYKWTGYAADAPILVPNAAAAALNMEGAAQIGTGTASLQVISDQGDDVLYGDGTVAKDFGDLIYRKFRSDVISSIDLTFPEINVTGNGIKIADGNTAINTTDNTDQGDVTYGNTGAKTFAIQNTGTSALSVSGISFSGTNAADYSIAGSPAYPVVIAAGSTYSITVQFTPQNIGIRTATMNITSDDNDEATYNFDIRGNGLCHTLSTYTVTGGGTMCSDSAGIEIGLSSSSVGVTYQLYNGATPVSGASVAGIGGAISFGPVATAGSYSVGATHDITGCTGNMTGGAVIIVNPVPGVHTFTGGGGFCTGDPGVDVGLTLTDTGISYQLFTGSTPQSSPSTGMGGAITFGTYNVPGYFYAIATNNSTGCTTTLPGVTIHMNALPDAFNITGGGSYCSSDGAGVPVGLDSSVAGIDYLLYNGAALVATTSGTGAPVTFGMHTAGTYTAMAVDATTGCMNAMNGTATADLYPSPAQHNVTGGGTYCLGGSGVPVGVDNSDLGIGYQVIYLGLVPIGSAADGTGAALGLGLHFLPGDYTVVARDTTTGCTDTMTGNAQINFSLPPFFYFVGGGGGYCAGDAGVHITLSGSQAGVRYQVYHADTAVGTPADGTGSSLDFGEFTTAGTYTVLATDTATGCTSNMLFSAAVSINPVVIPTVSLNTGVGSDNRVCYGNPITFTAQTTNGGSSPAYEWKINNITVTAPDSTYTYIPVNGDKVWVQMTSSTSCAVPGQARDTMYVDVDTVTVPSVSITVDPITSFVAGTVVTFTASVTNAGPAPAFRWFKNGTLIAGANTSVYTSNSLANRDSIMVEVTTSGGCGGMVTVNGLRVTVFGVGVPQTAANFADVRLVPNPNKGTFAVTGMLGTADVANVDLEVVNMLGQVVYKGQAAVKNSEINTQIQLASGLANGMYMLHLQAGNERKVFHFVLEE